VRDGGLVKMVVRPFSECDEGTRENNHQIIFLSVTKEHVKIIIRLFSKCHSGGGEAPENVSKNEVFYRANSSNAFGTPDAGI
jgi:hypothetical protein